MGLLWLQFGFLWSLTIELAGGTYFESWSPCHAAIRGEGRRALVTGITGMLGSHVAEALVSQGYQVFGVVRARSNVRNVAKYFNNITLVTAELTDPWRTLRIVNQTSPDIILHFAAQAFNGLSYDEPEYTLSTNIVTTLNILEAIRQLGTKDHTRILLAGSSTVYGASTEQWDGPIPETAQMQPVSPYGVSKASTELLANQYAFAYGLQVVVPRFFIHLATRGVESLALHEFARQIAMIERGLQSPVIKHGNLSNMRDITDIDDSARVVICLAEIAPSRTVVNIGSNLSYTVRDLLTEAVSKSTMSSTISLEQDPLRLRAYDERLVLADISRVRQMTGWRPQPDMSRLISDLLDYWRHEVEFRHPRFDIVRSQEPHSKAPSLEL